MPQREIALLQVLPSRQLEIVGQQYLLNIIAKEDTTSNTWRFKLENKRKGGLIPGGFKLRLVNELGESFPKGEVVATQAQQMLYLDLTLEPGTSLFWEIEPLPDNYQREILIF